MMTRRPWDAVRVLAGGVLACWLVGGAAGLSTRPAGADLPGTFSAILSAQQTDAARDEFVPIDELPPEDRLPAAPFLVGAYTVALVLLVGYVWLLWRRLATVQRELEAATGAQRREDAARR